MSREGHVARNIHALAGGFAQLGKDVHAGNAGGGHGGDGGAAGGACRREHPLAAHIIGIHGHAAQGRVGGLGAVQRQEHHPVGDGGDDVDAGDGHGDAGPNANAGAAVGFFVFQGQHAQRAAGPLAAGVRHGLQAAVGHAGGHGQVGALAQPVFGGGGELGFGIQGDHVHGDRAAQHGGLGRRDVAGLGDGGGIHPAVLHGHGQRLARGYHALFDAGSRVVGEGGDVHGDARGGVGGVLGDLHLAEAGDDGDGGVIVERAVRAGLGGGLAIGMQLHAVRGAHHAGGVDEGQDVVVDDGQRQRAHGLGAGHVLVRVGLGHALVEQAAQGVAAGDLAQRPGGGAGGAGAHAQHRLCEADHGAQRLLLGGLLGEGGVAVLVHIHADGRGDGVGAVADEAVGLGADGAAGADHRDGAARSVAVVAHIHPGAAQGNAHRHEHAALGFHAGDVGGAGNAGGLGLQAAAGVQQDVAAGGDGGSVGDDGLGLSDGHRAGKGEQRLGEAALIHRADVHFAVGAQGSARAAGKPGLAVHQNGGARLAPGKGQGDVAEQLGTVKIHQGGGQGVDGALGGIDTAVEQDLRGGLLDDDKVGEIGSHARHHVHHAGGLADGGDEVHRAGSVEGRALGHHDTDGGRSFVEAHAVFHRGPAELIFRHGDGQCVLGQNVRVLGFGQDEDVLAGHRAQNLHFGRLKDDGEAVRQQLFNGDFAGGFHQQVGQIGGHAMHGGGQIDRGVHGGVQRAAHHIVGEILRGELGGGHIAQMDGALVFQAVGHGVEAAAEVDVHALPQGHRVQKFLHDVDGQIGQQPDNALGVQVQAVPGLVNALFKGHVAQDVLAVEDILRGEIAGEVQAVVAAVFFLVDGHVQAEHIVEGAGGVQRDDVVAVAAGNDVLAAVLQLVLFQPVFGNQLGELLVKIAAVDHGEAAGDGHGVGPGAQVHREVGAAQVDVKIVEGHELAGTGVDSASGVDVGGVHQPDQEVVGAVAGVHVHLGHGAVFNVLDEFFHTLLDGQGELVGCVLDDVAGGGGLGGVVDVLHRVEDGQRVGVSDPHRGAGRLGHLQVDPVIAAAAAHVDHGHVFGADDHVVVQLGALICKLQGVFDLHLLFGGKIQPGQQHVEAVRHEVALHVGAAV